MTELSKQAACVCICEPEPAVVRGVMGEVYTKLPLFDDKVRCAVFLGRVG